MVTRRKNRKKRVEMETPAASRSLSRGGASYRLRNRSLNTVRLRRVFDLFDGNGDGELTAAEILAALARLGIEADPADLAAAVAEHAKPGRGGLDFEDFRRLQDVLWGTDLLGRKEEAEEPPADEELREAFRVFDVDGDGYISARELQEVLGKLGFAEGREIGRVEGMIHTFDSNCDGRVDFGEFKHMMRSFSIKDAYA